MDSDLGIMMNLRKRTRIPSKVYPKLPAKRDSRYVASKGPIYSIKCVLVPCGYQTLLGTRDTGQAKDMCYLSALGLLSVRKVGINQVNTHRNKGLQLMTTAKSATKKTEIGSTKAIRSHLHSDAFWLSQPTEIRGARGSKEQKTVEVGRAGVWKGSRPKVTECLGR